MHVHMNVCKYVCLCMYVYMYISMYICNYVCVCMYILCMYVCMCVCMYVCICSYVYIYLRMYICVCMYDGLIKPDCECCSSFPYFLEQ